MRKFFFIYCLSFLIAYAQQNDSTKTYRLEEITVKSGILIEPKTTTELSQKEITKSNATNIYELVKYIPSVKFQTNSRGENLFYIRGAGKRQTMVFFDGVPLNIPWDNRIDLSMVPSLSIGNMSAVKGMPSVTFGANTPAGVVTIYSKEPAEDISLESDLSLGSANFREVKLSLAGKTNSFSYLFSANGLKKDNFTLPTDLSGTNQPNDNGRTNTDLSSYSFYSKAGYAFNNNNKINFSISYSDANKGIAPELNVDEPRYWRYPVWNRTSFTFFGNNTLLGSLDNLITYSFSFTTFEQQINDYKDITYTTLNDIEKDKDNTFYGRILFTSFLNNSSLIKLGASGYSTLHKEMFMNENYLEYRYSQNLVSLSAEYEYLTKNSTLVLGTSYDISATPETGGKPHSTASDAYSFNSSYIYNFSGNISGRINLGRKTRFATLREAYSGALGRFVLNPDLKPETMNSIDGGIILTNEILHAEANLYYNLTDNGIVRISLPGKKFMRVNKTSIRTYGVEFITNSKLTDKLKLSLSLTYLDSKAKGSGDSYTDTLEYKPSFISSAILDYTPIGGFNIFSEFKFVSKEFGLKEGSVYFNELPEYLLVNIRFGYEMPYYKEKYLEFYFRINNLFDKLYYTQWGLPDPGREFFSGINIKF